MSESKNFMKEYKNWAKANGQHGKFAMSRFVMLKYMEAIQAVSDDFIFKGGNLLWHYIKTPRSTVDLDISTITSRSGEEVKTSLTKAGKYFENVAYSILNFKGIETDEGGGASVTIGFTTDTGQRNQFELDVVYALTHDIKLIKSTISSNEIQSASIENIICDKISASYQFGSGNTRMKDFDDLWRISKSSKEIDFNSLRDLAKSRDIKLVLDISWIGEDMNRYWQSHQGRYKDLPESLGFLFNDVNSWLDQ